MSTPFTLISTRITLMLTVLVALCTVAYTLGGAAASGQVDASGIPAKHPVILSLHYQKELSLSDEQVAKLTQVKDAMAKEFEPLRIQATSLQAKMKELKRLGPPDAATKLEKLNKEGDALAKQIQPLFERYAQSVGPLLTPDQRQKLMNLSAALDHESQEQIFVLMYAMQAREQLRITPQQFTKLQYLQADFIRAFAPLREKIEILQMEVKAKFGDEGGEPSAELRQKGESLQRQIRGLQENVSKQAMEDVLQAPQREQLKELLRNDHGSDKDAK